MLVSSQIRRSPRNGERGYVLLALLLLVSVAAIVFLFGVAPTIKFNIKRDREEEMIHRGVQYSRAIQAYYRKFQRFPAKIEDLENTNQIRFLRKRYKDPITGKDFRLLHYGDSGMMGAGGMPGGAIPGGSPGANGLPTPGPGYPPLGQNPNSAPGQNNQPPSDSSDTGPGNGQDSQDASNSSGSNGANGSNTAGSGFGPQLGGGPIVGVASLSKDPTIREFDKKRKYNDWKFVYDPTMDRGGLIKTPYQPTLMTQGVGQSIPNMNGQNGTSPNGNGFGNTFGNGNNGFGNGNNGFNNGNNGFGNSNNSFGNSFGNSPGGMQNTPAPPPSQPSPPQ